MFAPEPMPLPESAAAAAAGAAGGLGRFRLPRCRVLASPPAGAPRPPELLTPAAR